jgi:hypothetical protein
MPNDAISPQQLAPNLPALNFRRYRWASHATPLHNPSPQENTLVQPLGGLNPDTKTAKLKAINSKL